MTKVTISCDTEKEKDKIIKILSVETTVKKISKTSKDGKYYRVYLDIK